jgi:hypothetical protein
MSSTLQPSSSLLLSTPLSSSQSLFTLTSCAVALSLRVPEGTISRFLTWILPSLGHQLRGTGLSSRTARRWLYKLGWRRTELKKGVYMDGHKRPDVVEYRNTVFLPLMASLERRMVQWVSQGSNLVRINPDLVPGKKRVIAVFQDESSFHVNEFKKTIWCTQ